MTDLEFLHQISLEENPFLEIKESPLLEIKNGRSGADITCFV